MANLALTLITKDYDFLAPLACGDVVAEGIDLKLVRDSPNALDRTLGDPSVPAGELSLARHLIRLARDDRSFVAIPVIPARGFRHRCFFVRRDSGLRQITDLAGKRIGTNEWPATGNTWTRAALTEQGVPIEGIRWWTGSIDGAPLTRGQGTLPPYAQPAPESRALRDMLSAGELDALMCPVPPKSFYEPNSPIVRLYADFRRAEMEYFHRTGIYPIHHVVGIRRETFEQHPRVARALYRALDQSKNLWQANRRALADTTPWMLADLEDSMALLGQDWHPNGVEPNIKVVQALCDELYAQGLAPKRLDAAVTFAEYEAVK